MTLEELLSELRYNVLRDRSDLIAGYTDSLWSDETLLLYIKDAERRFARQTLCIRDSTTPEATQFRAKNGVQNYPLHASVLAVLSARFDTDSFDLQRSGHALILQFTPPEMLTFDPNAAYTLPPGRPIAFFTDETLVYGRQGNVTASLFPVPGTDEDSKPVNMRVVRLPLTDYSLDELDQESEIPEDYQLDVLEWAAYRALRGFDADAGAQGVADTHKAAFLEAVALAIKETKRKVFANATLNRGQNGFSWVR
jgi:hypothetical protein